MKLPVNSLTVDKGIQEVFQFLIRPDCCSLLLAEFDARVAYDKRAPIEAGRLVKLILPAERGQVIAELILSEYTPPHGFQYDLLSLKRHRKKQQQVLPVFTFVEKISIVVSLKEVRDGTRVTFTTSAIGLNGFFTKTFVYLFFGIPSWFSNKKYLGKLADQIDQQA